jgi:hypothetical protein
LGKTIPSYRQVLEMELARWEGLRKALRGKNIDAFDMIMNICRMNASAGSMATRAILTEAMFMSIFISQQRELMDIKGRLEQIAKRLHQT